MQIKHCCADCGEVLAVARMPWQHAGVAPPSISLGSQLLYRKTDVAQWLERQHKLQEPRPRNGNEDDRASG